jgi:O-antigen/teichoic acid export membrane protein
MFKNNLMLKKITSKLDIHSLEVVKKSLSSIVVKALGVVFGLGLSIFLGRTIGAEGLGIINLSSRIVSIMILLGLFGMSKVIIKEVAIAHNKKDLDHIANVMHSAYWLNGLIIISLSILLILASPWLANSFFEEPKLTYPLIIAFVVMTPQVFSRIFSSGLIGLGKIWQSNLVDQALSVCLTSVLVCITWLFVQELSVNMVATCYAIGRVGVTISVGLYWKKIYKNNVSSKRIFEKLLKTAKPLFFISIASIIINNSDIIILGFFSEAKDVGIYVVAARVALLTSVLLQITNSALSPKIAALYAENNIKSLEKMIKKITKGLFFIGLFVFLFFIFFGNWILSIWGEEFEEAYWILIILGFGQLVNISTGAVGIILIMTGHEKTQRNISLCFMMVFLIFSFTLIPIYGALGASIATATSVLGINMTILIYVKRKTKINIY